MRTLTNSARGLLYPTNYDSLNDLRTWVRTMIEHIQKELLNDYNHMNEQETKETQEDGDDGSIDKKIVPKRRSSLLRAGKTGTNVIPNENHDEHKRLSDMERREAAMHRLSLSDPELVKEFSKE